LSERYRRWGTGAAGRGLSLMSLLILVAGCHRGQHSGDATLLERISRVGHSKIAAPKPGELAEKGKGAIVTECEKQSYETASKGLIVSEIGLHEDVFVLRDRVSYAGVGYGLDEAQRLEELLRAEARVAGHPAEQANCIEAFAEHLETLSDPLVEADQRLKELDASAFSDATKEAQEQADKKLREADRSNEQRTQPAESVPQNY
jgi:single-stranded DNA-specific DHH superfamily exonuclease